jgi:hypothetical protein
MARFPITAFEPHLPGPLINKLNEHDLALDTLELLGGLVERQTLGGDMLEVTFAVDAADERVVIAGEGTFALSGNATYKARFNGASTSVTHVNHVVPQTGTVGTDVDRMWTCIDDSDGGFEIVVDLRAAFGRRGFMGRCWSGSPGTRRIETFGGTFDNAATPITSFGILSSASDGFKSGFEFTTIRRKMRA